MRNNDDLSHLPLILAPDNTSIKYYKQTIPVSIHHFYITEDIKDVTPYLDLINVLKTAESHDTVFIYLNTHGGNLDTTIQIISAIRQSQATVITSLEGSVASAGTLIFLSGTKFIVNPHCTFMIHNYSQFLGGKGNELVLQVEFQKNYFKKLAEDIYKNFLTTEEIDSMLHGKDLWMDSDEVIARLEKANAAVNVDDLTLDQIDNNTIE